MSDADHGAAAAAGDAMDQLSTDPEPDTEIHLSLTPARNATADDSTRADLLLVAIRQALRKYSDVRLAAADGFEELPGTEGRHTIHHLTNWTWARAEGRKFDPARPTSLLYREAADGTLALTGAMYTAPASSTTADLDRRIPLGLARWHRHTNWCAPKSGSGAQWLTQHDGAPLYGPRSAITTREACEAAGGVFYPGIFGWMVHVTFVGTDDPRIVWNGSLPPSASDSSTPRDSIDRARGVQVAATAPPPAPVRPRVTPVIKPVPSAAPAAEPEAPAIVRTVSHTPPPASTPSTPMDAPTVAARAAAEPPPPVATPEPATASPVAHPPDRPAPTVFAAPDHPATTFVSGHRAIAYDRFAPPGAGPHPAIVFLHGDGGLLPQAQHFQDFASALARRGYYVEIVHYFDRTGTVAADAGQRLLHFREWQGTVRDALSDLAQVPGVDSTRLAMFGTGVGASLALAVGAQDTRVRAVAEYEGSMPVWAVATVRRMPAVFIGQSDADPPAAVREANRISAICTAVQAPVELEVYAAPNNKGRGDGIKNVRQKTIAFLDAQLKP